MRVREVSECVCVCECVCVILCEREVSVCERVLVVRREIIYKSV